MKGSRSPRRPSPERWFLFLSLFIFFIHAALPVFCLNTRNFGKVRLCRDCLRNQFCVFCRIGFTSTFEAMFYSPFFNSLFNFLFFFSISIILFYFPFGQLSSSRVMRGYRIDRLDAQSSAITLIGKCVQPSYLTYSFLKFCLNTFFETRIHILL